MIIISDEGLEKGKRFLKTYYASCSVERYEEMMKQTVLCCEALDDFILQIREQIHNKYKNIVIYISDKLLFDSFSFSISSKTSLRYLSISLVCFAFKLIPSLATLS